MKSQLVGELVERVTQFNVKHNIQNPPTMWNLSYLANALTGETGEIANCVKKMLRDGVSEELRQNLFEEIVDNQIYIAMLIEMTGMDFDAYFVKKEAELEQRFARYQQRGFSVQDNMKKEWDN